jgi:hypothetical protein
MVKITIGDKSTLISKKNDISNWETLIDKIAEKSEHELEAWFLDQFGGLPESTRSGLTLIVKATWANSKFNKLIKDKIRLG